MSELTVTVTDRLLKKHTLRFVHRPAQDSLWAKSLSKEKVSIADILEYQNSFMAKINELQKAIDANNEILADILANDLVLHEFMHPDKPEEGADDEADS